MAKKNNKNSKTEVVNSNSENVIQKYEQSSDLKYDDTSEEYVIKVPEDFMKNSNLCIDEQYIKEYALLTEKEYGGLNNMGLFDLLQLEKACALICKRFETSARLDKEYNDKFNEYKGYYGKIFAELENRVSKICK